MIAAIVVFSVLTGIASYVTGWVQGHRHATKECEVYVKSVGVTLV